MQHPDITAACRDGYPSWKQQVNADCPEMRKEFIRDNMSDLVTWLNENHPDLVEEWMEDAGYQQWLNDE